jgi:GT2 family glycosyltransferase
VAEIREGLPSVAAIVVNFNGGSKLTECLESLVGQEYPPAEIILVDNSSTDGSADAAQRKFGDAIRVVRNSTNRGFAGANNQGILLATSDWVFLLNNDAVADRAATAELMRFARDRPEAGMLACRIMRHEAPEYFDSVGLLIYPDGISRPRGWQEKDLGQYDHPEEILAASGAAAAYRRSMMLDIGLFDERYFVYLEDLDVGMRAWLAGHQGWYVPTARARHMKSSTFGNYSKFKAFLVERNRIWNAVKLLPMPLLLASPLFTLHRYALQWYAAATRQGISGDFVKEYSYRELFIILCRAWASAMIGLPEMFAKRRTIARTRKLTRAEWHALVSRNKLRALELALKH